MACAPECGGIGRGRPRWPQVRGNSRSLPTCLLCRPLCPVPRPRCPLPRPPSLACLSCRARLAGRLSLPSWAGCSLLHRGQPTGRPCRGHRHVPWSGWGRWTVAEAGGSVSPVWVSASPGAEPVVLAAAAPAGLAASAVPGMAGPRSGVASDPLPGWHWDGHTEPVRGFPAVRRLVVLPRLGPALGAGVLMAASPTWLWGSAPLIHDLLPGLVLSFLPGLVLDLLPGLVLNLHHSPGICLPCSTPACCRPLPAGERPPGRVSGQQRCRCCTGCGDLRARPPWQSHTGC